MSCYECKHFSELKEPRVQKHHEGWEYTIYGYCFHKKGVQLDFHKGYAVFIPNGVCKDIERDKSKPEKICGQITLEDLESWEGDSDAEIQNDKN